MAEPRTDPDFPGFTLPSFSIEERDARWSRVRELMRRDGLDCIIGLGGVGQHNRNQADVKYLTHIGHCNEEVGVAFPIEGDVAAFTNPPAFWPTGNWIGKTLPPRGGWARALASWLHEHGFDKAKVGVIGLTPGTLSVVRQPDGFVPHGAMLKLQQALPNVTFVNATDVLGEARYVKSQAEVDFLRRGTAVAEKAMHAMVQTAGTGVFEPLVMGSMLQASLAAGGTLPLMLGWYSGPFGGAYHRIEEPTHRHIDSGDYLMVEIEGRWAGYVGQIDQSMTIGAVPDWAADAHKVAVDCFLRVFEKMKPGVAVGELRQAAKSIEQTRDAAGDLILHGRGLGDDGPLALPMDPPDSPVDRVELREGNVFLIKPNTTYKGQRDTGHVGDTVVVTASGAERLGTRPIEHYWHVN